MTATLLAMLAVAAGQASDDLRCGGHCLYVALRSLDLPVRDYAAVDSALGQPGPAGYSMQQIAEAAGMFGAHTLGVSTSLGNLASRPGRFACIARLRDGRFVNLYDARDGRAFLTVPPRDTVIDALAFEALWSGKALLIAGSPLAPRRGRPAWAAWAGAALLAGLALPLSRRLGRMSRRRREVAP